MKIKGNREKRYPAITVLGGEEISALYGVDNGIVDWQGVGLQHFFYKTYERDLIHSAVTYIKHPNGVVELGNRRMDGKSHPQHQHPFEVKVEEGYRYQNTFLSQEVEGLSWREEVYATKDNRIIFETEVFNEKDLPVKLELGSYTILRNPEGGSIIKGKEGLVWQGWDTLINIALEGAEIYRVNTEAPTGFVYRTIETLREKTETSTTLATSVFIGATMGRWVEIQPNASCKIRWGIAATNNRRELLQEGYWNWQRLREEAKNYWRGWLENEIYLSLNLPQRVKGYYEANLVAIKGAILGGFVPADITGHYFSNGSPCYYARDAMMIARGFLLSGHYPEAKAIINYLIQRPTKNNRGEFFQRYNAKGEASEGANNNVPHQLDSQGYFLRNLLTYQQRTGEVLLSLSEIKPYVNVLFSCIGASGMVGPEGGVNEGVFGPAYITSSNMFIYGGLRAAIEMALLEGEEDTAEEWRQLAKTIDSGIQSTWVEEEGRYGYGYITYGQEVVKKYDTPQYFGPLYGYPITQRIEKNNQFLLQYSSFFGDGIGYTEQEYHHGPWLFNTGACCQYQALTGNFQEYKKKVNWMMDHSNGYGLMPEAIDAQDEGKCFINPLTWACAEFVSTISILATRDGFRVGKLKNSGEIWG